VRLPPLRERPDDIPALVNHFAERLAKELGVPPYPYVEGDLQRLRAYDWPGNVRELRNLVERTLLLGRPPWESIAADGDVPAAADRGFPPEWTLERVEREHMRRVLEVADGNKSEAARRLGVSRKTLERKLQSRSDDSAVDR